MYKELTKSLETDTELREMLTADYTAQHQSEPLAGLEPEHSQGERISYITQNTLNLDEAMITRLAQLNPMHYNYSDRGSSELYADMFRHELRFDVTAREWRYFDGCVWTLDVGGMIAHQRAKAMFDALMHYSCSIKDEGLQSAFRKWYGGFGGKNRRDILLRDAQDCMFVNADMLDRDDNLLNMLNCTYNTDTMSVQQHSADDLLSKCANVNYNPDASAEVFERFIQQIMLDDADKIRYLQKVLGYSITADVSLECCWFWYGATARNGKGTLAETLAFLMGDYAATAMPETLARKQNKDARQASGDIARLAGVRFLNVSEPPKNMLLDEQLLKTLLGRDRITARHLHEREFEFLPKFKLHLNCNYLPQVSDLTIFKSDRVHIIPFDKHFSDAERDKALKDRLKRPENISGLLNWLLDGLKLFRAEGAEPPKAVKDATRQYADSSDKIGEFIRDCLQSPEQEMRIHPATVYDTFEEWCKETGRGCESRKNLIAELRRRGLVADRAKDDFGRWTWDLIIIPKA